MTVGGGPAGLYLAILLRRADPTGRVVVLERNGPDDAYGWGVVFSEQTLEQLHAADPETYAEVARHFVRWDDIDVHVRGRVVTSGGHGFVGVARRTLLRVLGERARALGADVRHHTDVPDEAALHALGLGGADVVVAADGVNSALRRGRAAAFAPDLDVRPNRFMWFGTRRRFEAFTFLFAETAAGVYQAHAYRFDGERSAFIVECDEASWRAAGFDAMDADATIAACEAMFAPWLEGHPLEVNLAPHQRAQPWQRFTRVACGRWHDGNLVLLGDAAHTAHFSIGSGTKLAMEDSIALARHLGSVERRTSSVGDALAAYEAERRVEALRLQNAARNSMEWFESVRRYLALPAEQFAYSLLTRSQRLGHENLRVRDDGYVRGVERWFAAQPPSTLDARRSGDPSVERRASSVEEGDARVPPMFVPFSLRGMTLPNRVVVAPMDMYCAEDGTPSDFHLVHYGARSLGGAGLVFTEMTCVTPDGRITPGCTGMYAPEHVAAWRRVTDMVHRWSPARICLQLGHSGPKGATKLMWEGNEEPLEHGWWETLAPTDAPYAPGMRAPRAMTRADMDAVRDAFVRAARMGAEAGFDMLELHCAHGYLLSAFITPLSNGRDDAYGGCLENRLRFPLEVFRAVRAEWPAERPMSVRVSATDWVEGGVDGPEAVRIARAFAEAGVDVVHVSAGQTSPQAKPVYGRLFQTPLSDRIRNEAGVPTIAVGNVTEWDQVNAILAAGRADLVALARPHLADPQWTLHAAAAQGYGGQWWPVQYLSGRRQLERARERELELRGTAAI
ncbi:bifunctional salicylyl-CoA 5-hydroxylase/oxidoreductase [Roseisolibacter sp. H3M3-2]|nr:bifunctional salicylyl-CoA 5-hydroxylase/oxidoreductase [Roseisolibacter sp. H3M3-2]MDF1505745.1 bifunctional salicylyl-CoA 5-hydroxylase/oxidoreductase [Roseisolibacter sp. H3M3-2]